MVKSATVSGDTRARILDTALDLFSTRTYKAASMREIAEHVGITKPSLYHHFRSKTEILNSLVSPAIEQLDAVMTRALTPEETLGGCIEAMLKYRRAMALLLRDASVYGDETAEIMTRVMGIVERATELIAGPKPDWRQRVRAAQAFAAATDPISMFPNVPDKELHDELLRGATAVLNGN
ncbi:hypothetical protein DMH04_51470 [Kibdelosporangium aridum]|uniref:HTH tetR-type domain-containing protein n=1 Tax=Kibdelosporangium aridum TaxID=2030 RepID=A0A428YA65_KIBAR|nr:hypothetical protein DMH04_51470 [Kibdelosporangium aridum]